MAQIYSIRRPSAAMIGCQACGSTVEAACDCGAPYVPAGQRAAEAIAANPGRSDRAIAAEIGVGKNTVMRARQAGPDGPPEKVTGQDGKSYPAQRKPAKAAAPPPAAPDPEEDDEDAPLRLPSDAEMKRIYDSAPEQVRAAVDSYLSLNRAGRDTAWQLINLYDQ